MLDRANTCHAKEHRRKFHIFSASASTNETRLPLTSNDSSLGRLGANNFQKASESSDFSELRHQRFIEFYVLLVGV